MLIHAEHEFTSFLAAWPASEHRIVHLYELDPTHVAAEPGAQVHRISAGRHSANASRSPLPFCLSAEYAPAAVLLELDPTH
ncbi:hypothetical protein GCM10027343_03310 [Noviherbaspirillum agri]